MNDEYSQNLGENSCNKSERSMGCPIAIGYKMLVSVRES